MRGLLMSAALLAVPGPVFAASLDTASVIVTGMDAKARPDALRQALGRVLAKESGNPDLRGDPRLAGMQAEPLVAGFVYLDRMSDVPHHDEQGTRDRPYDLIVRFDPARVDALLRQWGEAAWTAPRPVLSVAVEITPRRGPAFPLRADTDADERHRGALLAAAEADGLEVWLPSASGEPAAPGDAPTLHGRLLWSDAEFGWVAEWQLDWQGAAHAWRVAGVSFDQAYRDGMDGAVRVLSGHASR